jgi:hypothetical protein
MQFKMTFQFMTFSTHSNECDVFNSNSSVTDPQMVPIMTCTNKINLKTRLRYASSTWTPLKWTSIKLLSYIFISFWSPNDTRQPTPFFCIRWYVPTP